MPFDSSFISQQIYAQNAMFSGNMAYGQQLSYGIGASRGMAPPPPMAAMPMGLRPTQYGMFGEQMAMRMATAGQTMMGLGGVAGNVGASIMGVPMDPFGGALMGGLGAFGGGMGGIAMGAGLGAGIGGLAMGAGAVARAYGNAFMGGMQDQAGLNSVLRNNFNFYGGQGAFGRGFGQNQMGQIGAMVSQELRRSPFTNQQELNGLISGGAEAGMFTAVRDVQQFTQSFRRMLDTLRSVQRELGGTLTDALQFVRSSQQAGIFQNADRVNFASEVRSAEAVTGMDRNALVALSAQGSQIARSYGGYGRQGAMGALRMASALGGAISSGALSEEALSNATGGLTGQDAISAFTQNMLNRAGSFSRRPMGRYSTFALSNATGTGLDEDMMARFTAGDLSVSDVQRRAHSRVAGMGRARALNREGNLRGAIMEEGGLAAQIGMMRLMVGDRVMDSGDDLGSLVLQRRFGMSGSEAGVMMSLMRNQGSIAAEERVGRVASGREQAQRLDIEQNRSLDAFTRQLEHGLSDMTGLTSARETGRRFLTRVSALTERAMNEFLGVTENQLTSADRRSLARISLGQGSATDVQRLSSIASAGGTAGGAFDIGSLSRRSIGQDILHGLGMHTAATPAELLAREGVSIRGMSQSQVIEQARLSSLARSGVVFGSDRERLAALTSDRAGTINQLAMGQLAFGDDYLNAFSAGDRRGVLAFMRNEGMASGAGVSEGSLYGRGDGRMPIMAGMMRGAIANAPGGLVSMLGGALGGAMGGAMDPASSAAAFIARGGHIGADARAAIAAGRGSRSALGALGSLPSRFSMTSDQRALLEGISGSSTESVTAVLESDSFSDRLARLRGMSGNRDAISSEITAGRAAAMRMEDVDQRRAALSMYAQMERNVGRYGSIGAEFNVSSRRQQERFSQAAEQLSSTGATYSMFAAGLGRAGGGLSERLAGFANTAGRAFGGWGGAGLTSEDRAAMAQGGMDAQRSMIEALAGADPNTEEYRNAISAMRSSAGDSEEARAALQGLLAGSADLRGAQTALGGRGRRGRRQAIETAISMATGGGLGGMTLSVGGRSISGTRAMQMLASGGAGADELYQQIRTQMVEASGGAMSSEGAAEATGRLRTALGQMRGHRGLSEEQVSQFLGTGPGGHALGDIAGMSDVQRHGGDQALASARASNPLDAERNDILREIRERLPEATQRQSEQAAQTQSLSSTLSSLGDSISNALSSAVGNVTPGEA